jgi:hypothetical protein
MRTNKYPLVLKFNSEKMNGKVLIYKTLSSVFKSCFGDFNKTDTYKGYLGVNPGQGDSYETVMKKYKKLGLYGYASLSKGSRDKVREIHLWTSKKAPAYMIMDLISHELSHLTRPHYKNIDKEEAKAMKIAEVSRTSFQILLALLNMMEKKGGL